MTYQTLKDKAVVFRLRDETQPFKGVVQRVEEHGLWMISAAMINHLQGDEVKAVVDPVVFVPLTSLLVVIVANDEKL